MKVKIFSTDRIGISQEILTVFASKAWNLKSIEVESQMTFVHIEHLNLSLEQVIESLSGIEGITQCDAISQMPSEQRENHLAALLAKISDPIIDIDESGKIVVCNQAAEKLNTSSKSLQQQNVKKLIDVPLKQLLPEHEVSMSLKLNGQPFIADINPVLSKKEVSGSVITLKSMGKVGRQLALMQSSGENALGSIIGKSEKIQLVLAQIKRFSQLELPVLISGETGTGKELVARALHQLSERSGSPFLTINCAALPEQLLESELFGYEGGAFTGANRSGKPGLFELAQGGIVFLDEIAEMSTYLQAKLLRFLQDYKYRRVGGTKEFKADVKIISASHQNFTQLIKQRKFREDLYYRLNVLRLELPPLKEREQDIELLVQHFIVKAAAQVDQQTPVVSEEALIMLKRYQWPGNIRQLENMIFRLVALNDQAVIVEKQVMQVLFGDDNPNQDVLKAGKVEDWASAQAEFEIRLLQSLYPLYPSTRSLAQRLNVSHNKVAMKLRKYGIN